MKVHNTIWERCGVKAVEQGMTWRSKIEAWFSPRLVDRRSFGMTPDLRRRIVDFVVERERPCPGEMKPPWVAFPEITPDVPPTQGLTEFYDQFWRPFWIGLTAEEQAAYLDRWDASEEWRDVISFRYTPLTEEEIEDDRRYMEELRAERERQEEDRRSKTVRGRLQAAMARWKATRAGREYKP